MKPNIFKGSIVALITPFNKNGFVDEDALTELILWHIEEKTDGIVLCGTTGEAPTLTDTEKLQIFKVAVNVAKGRIPIIAGTGTYSTAHSTDLTKRARDIGVDACLVVLPYYNRPTEIGCTKHFEEIAKANLPIILYYHPGRTGIKLSLEAFKRMQDIDQIKAVKDAGGDLNLTKQLIENTRFPILAGDDNLNIDVIKAGGSGVISVIANIIPGVWKELNDLCLQNKFSEAEDLFKRYENLARAMTLETNPQCIKYAMSLKKKCLSDMRLPLTCPSDQSQRDIEKAVFGI
jgi:4-hydroxy-tetrahydrodipicolinate synthase